MGAFGRLTAFFCLIGLWQEAEASGRTTLFKYIDADGDPILSTQPEFLTPRELVRSRYRKVIREAAHKTKLDARLIEAVISIESNWNVQAVSPKGALGLM